MQLLCFYLQGIQKVLVKKKFKHSRQSINQDHQEHDHVQHHHHQKNHHHHQNHHHHHHGEPAGCSSQVVPLRAGLQSHCTITWISRPLYLASSQHLHFDRHHHRPHLNKESQDRATFIWTLLILPAGRGCKCQKEGFFLGFLL